MWNLFSTLVYLVSIFMDSLIIGFHLNLLTHGDITTLNSLLSTVMLIDIILKFFVAFRSNMADFSTDGDEDELEDKIDSKSA